MTTFQYIVKCRNRNPGFFKIQQSVDGQPGSFVESITASYNRGHMPFTNSLARDLARIGKGFFLCDRAFRRSRSLSGKTRYFDIIIPVENPEIWEKQQLRLEEWARFVSHDIWNIQFKKLAIKDAGVIPHKHGFKKPVVSLFSDGLDSLCGACYAVSKNENAIFVSHNPPGFTTAKKQIEIIKKLSGKSSVSSEVVNFQFEIRERDPVTGRRNKFPESRRRTRPLLYLSMAGAIALELKINIIRLNENGILAVNLPMTANRMGVANSRHAHPAMLRKFATILNKIPGGRSIKVENPFFSLTKGEETMYLKNAVVLVPGTTSCEFGNRQLARIKKITKTGGDIKECGLCVPCLIRRIALNSAGISEPADHYAYSVKDALESIASGSTFKKRPLFDMLKFDIVDILKFADKFATMSRKQFITSYIYELSLVTAEPSEITKTATQVYNLYQRFAKECRTFLHQSQ